MNTACQLVRRQRLESSPSIASPHLELLLDSWVSCLPIKIEGDGYLRVAL